MLRINQTVTSLPPLANRFSDDPTLQRFLAKRLRGDAHRWAVAVLEETGGAAATVVDAWSFTANKQGPQLHRFDQFGCRVDRIDFHPDYDLLRAASYGKGIIGNYYSADVRAKLGTHNETVKFAQGYLFSQGEQGLYCPICLTDGTAFLIERFGSEQQKSDYLPRLTSTNLDTLWEGSMFLTERAGGSDVGATETIAKESTNGRYALYGSKWFCSNANSEIAAILARVDQSSKGTAGLGLFIMPRHLPTGELNGAYLERLKDKLGTRSMATGELTLDGALAEPLGDLNRGFVQMAEMLNLSRLYNAVASVACSRRAIADSLRWVRARHAFGRPLDSFAMIKNQIVAMMVEQEAAMHAIFTATELRGELLYGGASTTSQRDRLLLRFVIPLLKYSSARLAVNTTSEAIEIFGGNGYVEDFGIARFFRDAQVLPVWEGTTNILVLDVFRTIQKDRAHEAFFSFVEETAKDDRITRALRELQDALPLLLPAPGDDYPPACRLWCDRALQIFQATILSAEADDERSSAIAEQYLLQHFSGDSALRPAHSHGALLKYDLITCI